MLLALVSNEPACDSNHDGHITAIASQLNGKCVLVLNIARKADIPKKGNSPSMSHGGRPAICDSINRVAEYQ